MAAFRTLFGFNQPPVRSVAIGMVLRSPTAANGNSCWFVEFKHARANICAGMRAIAERQILASGAAAVCDLFAHLLDNRRFNQIFVE